MASLRLNRKPPHRRLPSLPQAPRPALKAIAECFFDFAVSDLARYQLMNLRILPDFQPSAAAYQPAVQTLDRLGVLLRGDPLSTAEVRAREIIATRGRPL